MSSEDDRGQFGISRRKLLGSVATLGAAGAIGGAGTMAFFSDEEEFANNQLTAGELDLKVDWEEHYSDWSDDEANLDDDDDTNDLDVQMSNPGSGYTALPDPQNPLIWVADGDLEAFMDNTSVEAYPDVNDDGVQDPFGETTDGVAVGPICEDGADTPEALDSDLRTEESRGEPLVDISDVKPGDFGELTLSFHLCNNPGYVWLTGAPVAAAENGNPEPEEKDEDEAGASDETATGQDVLNSEVELLDAIQTTWWYDDGDNVLGGGAGGEVNEVDVMVVFDRSGSMDNQTNKFQNAKDGAKALVDALGPGAEVGLVSFNGNASLENNLGTDRSTVKTTIDGLGSSGSTAIGDAINLAQNELSTNGRVGANRVMVVLSNGGNNTGADPVTAANNAKGASPPTEIFGIAYGTGANETLIEDISTGSQAPSGIGPEDPNAFEGSISTIQSVFQNIGTILSSPDEEVIFRGSLRDSLTALSSGSGIPLDGDLNTAFDEVNEADDSDARECFMASNDYYIGFAWYLPVNHANEIQTDSVSFDLGFYTEQCRHNDGSGMANS
jgi:predicted ribosomally synthesized peptide with SipW-like signal peptide